MSMDMHGDRRRDLLLRDIVNRCQPSLEQRGFHLDGRGCTGPLCWVRFGCHARDDDEHAGTLVLLVAHDQAERALQVQTPRRKRIQRYEAPVQKPLVAQETVAAVCAWPSGI